MGKEKEPSPLRQDLLVESLEPSGVPQPTVEPVAPAAFPEAVEQAQKTPVSYDVLRICINYHLNNVLPFWCSIKFFCL